MFRSINDDLHYAISYPMIHYLFISVLFVYMHGTIKNNYNYTHI